MRSHASHSMILVMMVSLFLTGEAYSQMFKPQIDIALGGGINTSYFDVGGGTPGLSLVSTTMYHWTEHWKAGMFFAAHNVKGTD